MSVQGAGKPVSAAFLSACHQRRSVCSQNDTTPLAPSLMQLSDAPYEPMLEQQAQCVTDSSGGWPQGCLLDCQEAAGIEGGNRNSKQQKQILSERPETGRCDKSALLRTLSSQDAPNVPPPAPLGPPSPTTAVTTSDPPARHVCADLRLCADRAYGYHLIQRVGQVLLLSQDALELPEGRLLMV